MTVTLNLITATCDINQSEWMLACEEVLGAPSSHHEIVLGVVMVSTG